LLPSPGGALEPVGDDVGDLERRVGGQEQADSADVVDVWVGHGEELDGVVEIGAAVEELGQVGSERLDAVKGPVLLGPEVDQHGGAGELEEDGIRLPDVDEVHPQGGPGVRGSGWRAVPHPRTTSPAEPLRRRRVRSAGPKPESDEDDEGAERF